MGCQGLRHGKELHFKGLRRFVGPVLDGDEDVLLTCGQIQVGIAEGMQVRASPEGLTGSSAFFLLV